ncbi:hypothetical protein L226DRAFT_474404 [Lentinus tigrinus ALCF2SS1-7]|uniref:Uncharacterized protein n=1 Tax=Lentinus tigrinus ALCF2SS1-6 TaxID=1328759 RepID=A0A5C2RPC8_9APHY|nr:hypothetical protein L227DRAFT_515006 [Lentinus tigrinus ALCF2SS1-6]RPD67787.1 hypothetical protein L226DRAFT_474404 [Lentinus tigrinus ALCF2SS1-7]
MTKLKGDPLHIPPAKILPKSSPPLCDHQISLDCRSCHTYLDWKNEMDEILYLSNVHHCNTRSKSNKTPKGAKNTEMQKTEALIIKKGQPSLSTFTPAMSYLLCCNHDVTSSLSGTAIKSVIAYVADYITKTP